MKIYAPVKTANGVWCTVRFVDGVGETENPALIKWFKDHGYELEKCDEVAPISLEKCDEPKEVDLESMTPNELRDYAMSIGLGTAIKNIRNREKLLNIIRG
jgi:hypothetical protein